MTVPEVSRLESGLHNARATTIDRVAQALGKRVVSIDAAVSGDGRP